MAYDDWAELEEPLENRLSSLERSIERLRKLLCLNAPRVIIHNECQIGARRLWMVSQIAEDHGTQKTEDGESQK